jgi:hypothetical protein
MALPRRRACNIWDLEVHLSFEWRGLFGYGWVVALHTRRFIIEALQDINLQISSSRRYNQPLHFSNISKSNFCSMSNGKCHFSLRVSSA